MSTTKSTTTKTTKTTTTTTTTARKTRKICSRRRHSSIFILIVCQCFGMICSTRIPLEVYELTANAVTTAATARITPNKKFEAVDEVSVSPEAEQHYLLKHKHLEYAINEPAHENDTVNHSNRTFSQHSSESDSNNSNSNNNNNITIALTDVEANAQPLDRRRSRQMLDILNMEHGARFKNINEQQQHSNNYHNAAASLYLQKLYQQHQLHQLQQQQQQQMERHKQLKDNSISNKKEKQNHNTNNAAIGVLLNGKHVRILYQIGESEEDLPICAPNAVCSKIDLYETPWIERQCRCPDPNRIMHYHYDVNNRNNNKDDTIEIITKQDVQSTMEENKQIKEEQTHLTHAEKMRNYYEHNKRLLVGDYNDKKFESLHLKKLMQRLGAVYEDDLHIQPSDYLPDHENNDALSTIDEKIDEYEINDFPHAPSKSTHMRHSGHMYGHKAKDITFIGGCPSSLGIEDGHTIADKTRHYKLCQPVHKLPVCKHFRDYTWTLTTSNELNITEQIVHCRCPKNSVTYLTKREPAADGLTGYTYLFACSPLTRIRCQHKQPCKLFTVRKRQEFLDEVNINALCQCPKGHHCPSHHTQSGVIAGESFLEDNIQTYSGYCMAND